MADILAAARGQKPAAAAPAEAPKAAPPAPKAAPAPEPVAEEPAPAAPASAGGSLKGKFKTAEEICAYIRSAK